MFLDTVVLNDEEPRKVKLANVVSEVWLHVPTNAIGIRCVGRLQNSTDTIVDEKFFQVKRKLFLTFNIIKVFREPFTCQWQIVHSFTWKNLQKSSTVVTNISAHNTSSTPEALGRYYGSAVKNGH